MGFGVPAGIGAALFDPGNAVVVIVGDGGFLMSGMELATAQREGVSLTVVVFNDGHYGAIRSQQLRKFNAAFGVELKNPDYTALSSALGAKYFKLQKPFEEVMQECLACSGVKIIEVQVSDHPDLEKARRKAVLRDKIKSIIGPAAVRSLKRLAGK